MATVNPAFASEHGAPYRIPPEPSRLPSILLAAGMHAVLIGFLWVGIRWQNNEPVSVEAEVWDLKVQSAAPAPTPRPTPKAEAKPEPKPEPPPPPPPRPAKVEEPTPSKPDIALERQKLKDKQKREEKLLEEKRLEERRLEERREKEELKKRDELKKKEQDKKEKEKDKAKEKEKELAEQKAKDAAEKKAADKAAKAKEKAEDDKLAKQRDAEMKRIMGAAGGSGTAQQSTAPKVDKGYLASITSKIKSSTSYLGSTDVSGNPRAQFKVEQLPTGEIISVRLVKSSGVAGFDDAVEKGIMKSSPLPKKKDGTVERTLDIGFSMKDLN